MPPPPPTRIPERVTPAAPTAVAPAAGATIAAPGATIPAPGATIAAPGEADPQRASRITSTQRLIAAASSALKLRDEQLQARVKYYNKDLQTNAELDAITEQVVAELRAMGAVSEAAAPKRPRQEVEIELIHALRHLLEKLFSEERSSFLERKMEVVQRKITQLFFNSELYARLAEGSKESQPAATWPEQALYFALKAHEDDIISELLAMPVSQPMVRDRAIEDLNAFLKRLCSDFLGKTTPELERVLAIYRDVLTHFFFKVFPEELGDFAWEVVRESRVADDHSLGYKITAEHFDAFRETFDRKFLERLVLNVQEPIVQRASADAGAFREATLRFVADPRIHAEICATINDALYDYLHGEGYLDLPTDWKRLLRS
jgi:hypothetical protein